MQKDEKGKEKSKGEKRRPYQKPELTVEELFEATVLQCIKAKPPAGTCASPGKS